MEAGRAVVPVVSATTDAWAALAHYLEALPKLGKVRGSDGRRRRDVAGAEDKHVPFANCLGHLSQSILLCDIDHMGRRRNRRGQRRGCLLQRVAVPPEQSNVRSSGSCKCHGGFSSNPGSLSDAKA
ncbi:hypothetical protein MKX08_008863 [Trichoderma sp. CBMAI-0020]|nr:hypothetical protein MKX08_008863 [Trichoderma sp. CBMAI-0020]